MAKIVEQYKCDYKKDNYTSVISFYDNGEVIERHYSNTDYYMTHRFVLTDKYSCQDVLEQISYRMIGSLQWQLSNGDMPVYEHIYSKSNPKPKQKLWTRPISQEEREIFFNNY